LYQFRAQHCLQQSDVVCLWVEVQVGVAYQQEGLGGGGAKGHQLKGEVGEGFS